MPILFTPDTRSYFLEVAYTYRGTNYTFRCEIQTNSGLEAAKELAFEKFTRTHMGDAVAFGVELY